MAFFFGPGRDVLRRFEAGIMEGASGVGAGLAQWAQRASFSAGELGLASLFQAP